ncbi:MAG: hypothetical protein ACUVWX_13865, partial [Kiritimatiellia bacterium]
MTKQRKCWSARRWMERLVIVAILVSWGQARGIEVQNGGSFLNDFELVGCWQCRPGSSGYRNCNDLALVVEHGTNYLYAYARGGTSTYLMRKYQLPTPGSGYRNVTEVGTRNDAQQALAFFPVYAGGTLCSHGTYLSTGGGYTGGSDGAVITAEAGDTNLYDTGKSPSWYYCNGGGTFIPAALSLTGNYGFAIVRNGGGTPYQSLMWLEVNTNTTPHTWMCPQLPGRGSSEDDRSVLMNLSSQLGIVYVTSAELADYSVFKAQPTLYILANHANDTFHLIALTPGPDGKFGETSPGVCDDIAVGYTFGEPGQGNSYLVEKQHITWENAPGNTTLVDIDGSYSTGYSAV